MNGMNCKNECGNKCSGFLRNQGEGYQIYQKGSDAMIDDVRNMVAYGTNAGELVIDGIGESPYGTVTICLRKQACDVVGILELGECFAAPDEGHIIKDKIIVEGIPVDDAGENNQQKRGNA